MAVRPKSVRDSGLLRSLAVPALLVVVALLQIVRVDRLDQSSWSGVGFGMFATVDNETSRTVRGYQRDGDVLRPVPLPPELDREAFELRVVPSDERARTLARSWAAHADGSADAFVVEVWGLSLEGPDLVVSTRLVRRSVVDL